MPKKTAPYLRSPQTGAQKKGVIWKRTRHSHRGKQDPVEKAVKLSQLEMLQCSAAVGEIDLFYLDEQTKHKGVGIFGTLLFLFAQILFRAQSD